MLLIQWSVIGIFLAFFLHQRGQARAGFAILLLTGSVIYVSSALMDPYLNLWDERFHALVAKNMVKHPFKPMLYNDPVLDMNYFPWDRYHIWLHKQPLFLWQIALSFRLFGVSEFTLRLPSVMMSMLLIPIAYRSGKLLVGERVGFYAAALMAGSYYLIDLCSGRQLIDHNDLGFVFYVSASIWAWLEYIHSGRRMKKNWLILTGILSGCAILVKWLPGLLVYWGWGVYNMVRYRWDLKVYFPLIKALAVTILVAAPWQIYTFLRFPDEKAGELDVYSQHFMATVDGQTSDFFYHFKNIDFLFGDGVVYAIIPAMIILYSKIKNKALGLSLITMPVFVYLFFSIAQTKMPSFTFIVVVPVFIALAAMIAWIEELLDDFLQSGKMVTGVMAVALTVLIFFQMHTGYLDLHHHPTTRMYQSLYHNKMVFLSLDKELPENAVIFNVPGRHYIECMFYANRPAYPIIPSQAQVQEMRSKNRKVAVFDDPALPEALKSDPAVILIRDKIIKYED